MLVICCLLYFVHLFTEITSQLLVCPQCWQLLKVLLWKQCPSSCEHWRLVNASEYVYIVIPLICWWFPPRFIDTSFPRPWISAAWWPLCWRCCDGSGAGLNITWAFASPNWLRMDTVKRSRSSMAWSRYIRFNYPRSMNRRRGRGGNDVERWGFEALGRWCPGWFLIFWMVALKIRLNG